MTNPTPRPPFIINARLFACTLASVAFTLSHDLLAPLGEWYYLPVLGLVVVAAIYCGMNRRNWLITRLAIPTVLIAYGALLVVIVVIPDLSPAWPVLGPILVAAAVGVCSARNYEGRGSRLPFGVGLIGCGIAVVSISTQLLVNPIVWRIPEVVPLVGLLAGIGGSGIAAGAAVLTGRPRLLAGTAVSMFALITAEGVLGLWSLDAPLGVAVLTIGLANAAVVVPRCLGHTRIARIGMVACGLATLTAGLALLISSAVVIGWCLLVCGAVQAGGGVALLLGRRAVIEAYLVLIGVVIVCGGIAAVIIDLRAYGVAIIGLGIAVAVPGLARFVEAPRRRLIRSSIRFA